MKVVHTADLHIGMETHGPIDPQTGLPRRLDDFLASLDRIVDAAIDGRADLVVMAGDIYKSRDPSPTHQRAFARRILRLASARVPVFLLAGNHDVPNAVSRATSIDIFHELEVAGVTVGRQPDCHRVDTPSGPAIIAALPWITRSVVVAHEGAQNLLSSDFERYIADFVVKVVGALGERVEEMRGDPELRTAPAILVAHLHAQEARDGAERMLTVGNDPLIPASVLTVPPFDYVALGHIHAHQSFGSQPPAVYPGSIERVNFGEELEDKGYVVAEVSKGHAEWEFFPVPARRFLTIPVKATGDDPTAVALRQIDRHRPEIDDAVVRLRVELTAQNEALFDEGRARAALAGAFWIAEISRQVDRPARTRFAGASVEGKTPMELLDEFFSAKQLPSDERERLRSYAQRLIQSRL